MNNIDNKNYEKYMKEVFMNTLWDMKEEKNFKDCGDRKFKGNFLPCIVKNCLLRYTKESDEFLDPCVGSGTSIDMAKKLNRKCFAADLFPNIKYKNKIIQADVCSADYLNKKFKLIIFHPPYAGIIKYSDEKQDLSNVKNGEEFLQKIKPAIKNLVNHLEEKGWLCLVIGDYYLKGEYYPLAFRLMDLFLKEGLILKSINIKDSPDRANYLGKNYKLWCYRHLKYGTYFFKHEYVIIFRNRKKNFIK